MQLVYNREQHQGGPLYSP